MFAGNDARLFSPLVDKVIERLNRLKKQGTKFDLVAVKKEAMEAYQEMFDEEFSAGFLSRLRISNIADFRKNGFTELGPDVHREVYRELAKFDLGIQLIFHGYDNISRPHVFEVTNPGKIVDHDMLQYGVIGSGYWMATASLRRRQLSRELNPTIYRLLEAKFSAETATGVGKATTVFVFGKNGEFEALRGSVTDQIRDEWKKTLKPDAPPLALDLIKQYIELEKPEPKKTTSSLAAVSAEQLSQTPVQTVGGLLPPQAPERS
jgi:ATP-dependent exoDNAse (exonuclease V) alpha subunit